MCEVGLVKEKNGLGGMFLLLAKSGVVVREFCGKRKEPNNSVENFVQLFSQPTHQNTPSRLRSRMAATFKSIRAVIPLLDRVLVQRFKPEQVRV